MRVGDEIRRRARQSKLVANDRTISFTVSAGVAHMPPCRTLDELLSCSDQALYIAKREGRDRTVVHSASLPGQHPASDEPIEGETKKTTPDSSVAG